MGVKKNPNVNLKDILLQSIPYDQEFTTKDIVAILEKEKGIVCSRNYSESNLHSIWHQLQATGIDNL
ncbi:MAG: hypothetical protein LUC90_06655 [Lachnospiraceae bacterium]|nr:hypothetical protein [Lachnospiraceae bacterium]